MNLKIEMLELERLLKVAFPRKPTKKSNLSISARDASLVLQNEHVTAGTTKVIITKEGSMSLPAKTFLQIVDSYKGTSFIEIEILDGMLRINTLKMRL